MLPAVGVKDNDTASNLDEVVVASDGVVAGVDVIVINVGLSSCLVVSISPRADAAPIPTESVMGDKMPGKNNSICTPRWEGT